jgi:hypothetical protein
LRGNTRSARSQRRSDTIDGGTRIDIAPELDRRMATACATTGRSLIA